MVVFVSGTFERVSRVKPVELLGAFCTSLLRLLGSCLCSTSCIMLHNDAGTDIAVSETCLLCLTGCWYCLDSSAFSVQHRLPVCQFLFEPAGVCSASIF